MRFEAISNISPSDARVQHYPIDKPRRWKGIDKFYRVVGYDPENYSEAEFRDVAGLGDLDLVIPFGDAAAKLDDGHEALMLGLDPTELDAVGKAGKLSELSWFGAASLSFSLDHLRVLAEHAPKLKGVYANGASLDDEALQRLADPTFLPRLDVFHAINVPVSEAAVQAVLEGRREVFWVFAPRATAS